MQEIGFRRTTCSILAWQVLGVAAHNLVEPMLHVVHLRLLLFAFRFEQLRLRLLRPGSHLAVSDSVVGMASSSSISFTGISFPSWLLEGRFGFCQLRSQGLHICLVPLFFVGHKRFDFF